MTTEFGLGRRLVRSRVPVAAPGDVIVRGPARHPRWRLRYSWLVAGWDVAATAVPAATYTVLTGTAAAVPAVVLVITVLCLGLARAWDPAALGRPSTELGRLLRGLLAAAGAIGLLSLAFDTLAGRPWVFGVLPTAAVFAVGGRLGLRRVVGHLRRHGSAMTRVLAVGSHESVTSLVDRARRAPELGWSVVAACTPTGAGPRGSATVQGVPVVGDLDAVPSLARGSRFDAVSVSQAPGWSPRRLQQLAWHLEGSSTELLVDPGLLQHTGPRTHLTTVEGLHLLRLSHPAFPSTVRVLKSAVDRVGAGLLLVLIAPLLGAIALAVRRDGGPALVRDETVGDDGGTFGLLTFRCTDAEDGAATPVGAFLRRTGLDGLPQLVNVAAGEMSIVGPYPAQPGVVRRSPLVKPGLTGLWTVGPLGHAEPDGIEASYVENWTIALDLRLVARALRR